MARETIHLQCTECKRRNYTANRNKKQQTKKLQVMGAVDIKDYTDDTKSPCLNHRYRMEQGAYRCRCHHGPR